MPRAVQRMVTTAAEYVVPRAAVIIVRALDRDVIGQAHQPRGAAGSVNGWMFAHRPSNRQRNCWAVSLLDVQPTSQVLEIGFGPGVAVAELVRAGAGHIYGIDHSAVMLRQASRRNAAAIGPAGSPWSTPRSIRFRLPSTAPSTSFSPSSPSRSGPRRPSGSPNCGAGWRPAGASRSCPSPAATAPLPARPAAPPVRSRTCCASPASRR